MLLPIVFAFTGGLLLIILGLGYKHASVVKSRAGSYGTVFMGLAFLIAFAYSLFEKSSWGDWRLWAIGLAAGAIFVTCVGLFTWANRIGPPSTSWVVINLSCVLGIVLSVAFLPGERFRPIDTLIIALFVGMLFTLHAGMKPAAAAAAERVSLLFWPLVLTVFALNGTHLFLMKIKDAQLPSAEGDNGATLAICYGSAGIAMLARHLLDCRRRGEAPWRRGDVVAGLMTGFGAGLGNIFLLKAMSLPAVVVLPICQGVPMIGGVIAMALVYRERFNLAKVISLLLALATLLLAIFRDAQQPTLEKIPEPPEAVEITEGH